MSGNLITATFNKIEADEALYVDTNELWLPNSILGRPERGQVYRVADRLFLDAFQYREGLISQEEFLARCRRATEELVFFSDLETRAFREWGAAQIESARTSYPKNKTMALKYAE